MLNLELHNNSENNLEDVQLQSFVTAHTEYINYNKFSDPVSTMISYIESEPQTPQKNLFIKDLSWKHPRNNINYILEYEESKDNFVFKSPFKDLYITNVTSNSGEPFYFKHKTKFKKDSNVSLTIKKSGKFLEGESISTSGWKLINQHVYNNYENKFDFITGSYELYFISGVDENGNNVNELLSNVDSIGEFSWRDIDPDTGLVRASGYTKNQIGSEFEFNINLSEEESCNEDLRVIYIKTKSENIIKLMPPQNFDMENSWNVQVQNGFFFKDKVYRVTEFDNQSFNPEYGIIKIFNKRSYMVGRNNSSHIIKVPVRNIHFDPENNSNIDVIVKDINDNVIFGATSDINKLNSEVENSGKLFNVQIKSVNEKEGFIELEESLNYSNKIYCTFHQKCDNYTIENLNLNPINNKKILEGFFFFYLKPNMKRYEKSIEWLYLDRYNEIIDCSEEQLKIEVKDENGVLIYNPNTVIKKDLQTFKNQYCFGYENFKKYLELGEVSYEETEHLDELNTVSIKDNTPVNENNYLEMISRQWKILQSKFGYGEEGQVYQNNNIVYVKIMKSMLKDFGGQYSKDELYDLLKSKLMIGTELILDFSYFDLNIEVNNSTNNKIKVSMSWEGPGNYVLVRRNIVDSSENIILLNQDYLTRPENDLITFEDVFEETDNFDLVHYFYRYKNEESPVASIKIRK